MNTTFKIIGFLLIAGGLSLIGLIYAPVIKQELKYRTENLKGIKYTLDENLKSPQTNIRPIIPVATEFGIVIPKINVNAEIFPEINPANPEEFLPKLSQK